MPKTVEQLSLKERTSRLLDFRFSFFEFCYGCLGYKDIGENNIYKELCNFLQRDSNKSRLILMPRYSFKSSIATVAYSLWRLYCNHNLRILIYSDAATKAVGFLNSIKAHIEGRVAGSEFRQHCPAWETNPRAGKWSESQIVISVRKTSYPEPTIDTGGTETSKTGFHYDIIIFDDIVSDKNVTTKDQMDKVVECYRTSLSLLKPGGDVLLVGTRWHFGDLYGRIIAENDSKHHFGVFLKKAEVGGKYLFDNIGPNSLTEKFLSDQRASQGSYLYSCIYQNEPTDPETQVFKTDNFGFYGKIKKDDLFITCTCDPAGEGEDLTGITVVGTDHKMNMHVLDVVNKHMQPSEIIDEIIRLNYEYKFKKFGLETNFFRGMLRKSLNERIDEERLLRPTLFNLFGIEEFKASSRKGQNKTNRIMALQPYHESGALMFPGEKVELLEGGFKELAWQMIQFPNSAHDDVLDSLAYHIPLARKGGVVKKQGLPRNTPAWLERESLNRELRKMANLPRRWRKPLDELAFS